MLILKKELENKQAERRKRPAPRPWGCVLVNLSHACWSCITDGFALGSQQEEGQVTLREPRRCHSSALMEDHWQARNWGGKNEHAMIYTPHQQIFQSPLCYEFLNKVILKQLIISEHVNWFLEPSVHIVLCVGVFKNSTFYKPEGSGGCQESDLSINNMLQQFHYYFVK